jgi:hypothetical protein
MLIDWLGRWSSQHAGGRGRHDGRYYKQGDL